MGNNQTGKKSRSKKIENDRINEETKNSENS